MPAMEPRMRPRPKGPQFSREDLGPLLHAFGDVELPLRETVRVLDDIVTDFVIETCHEAESHARHAGRAKIKVDDFQFALRRDSKKLGRVQQLLDADRDIKRSRRAFEVEDGKVQRDAAKGTRDDKEDGDKDEDSKSVKSKKSKVGKKRKRATSKGRKSKASSRSVSGRSVKDEAGGDGGRELGDDVDAEGEIDDTI